MRSDYLIARNIGLSLRKLPHCNDKKHLDPYLDRDKEFGCFDDRLPWSFDIGVFALLIGFSWTLFASIIRLQMILATTVCSQLLLRSNRKFCAKSDRIFDTRIASATKWELRADDKFRRTETEKSNENSLCFMRRRHRCLIIRSAIGRKNKTMVESDTSDQIRTNARPVTRCRLSHPISASLTFIS